ncbi:response regulator transcription factor [Dysgonomonas sp. GY75]|uniref:response regulator transcription factor n=1 Tax=Dysgonomonas sp. GY75 TaxID=2780419 RepID=UPI0018842B02|nr:response regulator transcription factor [Dysgonomonas sp. GY75]MBF0651481.1 response regulator transcription factor [Dysgonomonas sp. GY75]
MEYKKPVKEILIIDDHAGILWGIKAYLNSCMPELNVMTFSEGIPALKQIQAQKYDVYIIDIELQDIGGLKLVKKIREYDSEAKIIIYTKHEGIWDIINYKAANVNGIVLKGPDLEPLKSAIDAVLDGEKYICERFRYLSVPYNDLNPDSHLLNEIDISFRDSEMEIIQLLAKGKTYKEISKETPYKENSVPKTKARIFDKFSVNSSEELITKALTNGFPVRKQTKDKKGY